MISAISGENDATPPPGAWIIQVTFTVNIPTTSTIPYNLEIDAGDTTRQQNGDGWDFYIAPYNFNEYNDKDPGKAGSIFSFGTANNGISRVLVTKQNFEITAAGKVSGAVFNVYLSADIGAETSGFTFSLSNYSWQNSAADPSWAVQLGTNINNNGTLNFSNSSSGGLFLKCQ